MGRPTFVFSGVLAVGGFVLVLFALRTVGRERLLKAWRGIVLGSAGVLAVINLFYFTNVLPPLPLALSYAGVFHSVVKDGDAYRALCRAAIGQRLVRLRSVGCRSCACGRATPLSCLQRRVRPDPAEDERRACLAAL